MKKSHTKLIAFSCMHMDPPLWKLPPFSNERFFSYITLWSIHRHI